jgi:hypothetical protein
VEEAEDLAAEHGPKSCLRMREIRVEWAGAGWIDDGAASTEVCRGLDLRFEWGSKGTSIRLPTSDSRSQSRLPGSSLPECLVGWAWPTAHSLATGPRSPTPSVLSALDWYVFALGEITESQVVHEASLCAQISRCSLPNTHE